MTSFAQSLFGRIQRVAALRHGLAAAALGTVGLLVAGSMPAAPIQASAPRLIAPRPVLPLASPVLLSEAERLNAALPIAAGPTVAAAAFISRAQPLDYARSLECLTAAVYYEAASEGEAGERAVAQVVLNRMRHPAFPKSICGVVFEGVGSGGACQFSFACDGAMDRPRSAAAWQTARLVAIDALSGHVEPGVGLATHYHTVQVVPFWRDSLTKVAVIGQHIFYRWSGDAGLPAAFSGRYSGREARIDALFAPSPVTTAQAVALAAAAEPSLPAAAPLAAAKPVAAKLPDLAADLSGMAEVADGPRIILPQTAPTPAPTAG